MTAYAPLMAAALAAAALLGGCAGSAPSATPAAASAPAATATAALDVYLVRHGQTDWNLQKRLQGGTDNPLNATGQQQARELAGKLAGVKFDHIYSSALTRARQTAGAFAGSTPVTPMPALNERSFGKFEGIFEDQRDAQRYAEFQQRGKVLGDALDGGESLQSQADRVKSAVQQILQRHRGSGGSIAIVAHGGVNPLALAALLDMPVAEAVQRIKQGNDEVYLVRLLPGQPKPAVWKLITRDTLEQL
ncbi:MAG: histidine phosphatase family protein [Pseudomonadota bacterium]|nr:histidine phosphatase family protein [Pseudomonadota bacterium]